MLPSVRLIVATFLFGFVLVFASLRVAVITQIPRDSLPALATPAIAAGTPAQGMSSAGPVVAVPPLASVPAADPRRAEMVPVMFDLNAVIRSTAAAPEAAPVVQDPAPAPARLATLSILPEITALQEMRETTPPAELAKLTILPDIITVQSMPEAAPVSVAFTKLTILPGVAPPEVTAAAPAEVAPSPMTLAALTILPDIAVQSIPPAPPVEPPPATAAEQPTTAPEAKAAQPIAAYAPPERMRTEATGSVEPPTSSSIANASNQMSEPPPVTVWVRLPLAKKPPPTKPVQSKAKTAQAKQRQAALPSAAQPAEPPLPTAEQPAIAPETKPADSVVAYAPAEPAGAEATGTVDPSAFGAPDTNASDQISEAQPVTVWIRLPVPKKPPLAKPAKTKTAQATHRQPPRQPVARDPFNFNFNFGFDHRQRQRQPQSQSQFPGSRTF